MNHRSTESHQRNGNNSPVCVFVPGGGDEYAQCVVEISLIKY